MAKGGVATAPRPAARPPPKGGGGGKAPKTGVASGGEGGKEGAIVSGGEHQPNANVPAEGDKTQTEAQRQQREEVTTQAGVAQEVDSTDAALDLLSHATTEVATATAEPADNQTTQPREAGGEQTKIFDDPKEDPAIQAIEQSITTQINSDSEVQNALQSGDATYTAEWQRAHTRIGNRKWDGFVVGFPDKASAYSEKYPQIKAALERKAQAEAAAASQTTESAQEEPLPIIGGDTTKTPDTAAMPRAETNLTPEQVRALQKRALVLGKSKSEALKQLRTWIRMEAADKGETLTAEQEIQQARDQFIAEQTDIAMGRLGQGDTIEQITADGQSLFQEQQRKVRIAMEAEGRTPDEAFEGEVTRRSLHAYFQERDRITTDMMEGDRYKDEHYAIEQIKQGVSRVVEQAKLAGKTEISNKEAIEQAQREFANLRAESLQARPDGIPAEVQENPYFQKAMKEVHARRKDLAERNGIEMDAAWYADVQEEALTEGYVEELKEKKTLLQILLEAFKQATISFGIVGVNMLKGEFEATATGK